MSGFRRVVFLLLGAMTVLSMDAQQVPEPDTERGARPGLTYNFYGLDHVNLFNGTVTMNVPIGQTYSVGSSLQYGFTASYATNTWATDTLTVWEGPTGIPVNYNFLYPSERENAGLGWVVTLGDLQGSWYRAPDGGVHVISGTPISYTADGTYLRAKDLSVGREIYFPNGETHRFDDSGRLTLIYDPFWNWVNVQYTTQMAGDPYPGSTRWIVTDSVGRTHSVYFRGIASYDQIPEDGSPSTPHLREIVHKIVLATFDDPSVTDDGKAEYVFNYTAALDDMGTITPADKTSRRSEKGLNAPMLAEYVVTPLLKSIAGPESAEYLMTYDRGDQLTYSPTHLGGASGNITKLVLPTGSNTTNRGRMEWTYQSYQFKGPGVKDRKTFDGTTLLAHAQYEIGDLNESGVPPYDDWRRVVNRDGAGVALTATRHYFSRCRKDPAKPPPPCSNPGEYGYPLTRIKPHPSVSNTFLSTEIERPESNGTFTPVRKTWVRYEGDQLLTTGFTGSYNQRLVYERTEYEGGKYSETTYSDYDGLGHYRKTVTGGDFESGNVRTTFTNYNPSVGTFGQPGFTPPGESQPWILTTYNKQWVSEGGKTGVTAYCFDSTGFLTSRRTFTDWGETPSAKTTDLLALFTRDAAGNLTKEQYFGGDEGSTAPTSYNCNTALTGESYRIDHGYQYGVRNASKYVEANGSDVPFDLLDMDIDRNTGLPRVSRSFSAVGVTNDGVATSYQYDKLGRLTKMTSPKLRTEYAYQFIPPKLTTTAYDIDSAAQFWQRTTELDAIGRTIRETRTMPDSVAAERRVKYNGVGWKTEELDWGATASTLFTYDIFGRPVAIRAPDQTDDTAVKISYNGVSGITRTTKVRTSGNASPLTSANLTDAETKETYDRQGRLIRLTEPKQSVNGTQPVTEYEYDLAGRLTKVCANKISSCGQTRSFAYDNRGFLTSETHPESGTTTYASYDARGHLRRRFLGSSESPVQHLGFVYDRAERLKHVHEADANGAEDRKLKYFIYANSNAGSNLRIGRLTHAMRFNWVTVGGSNFNVRVVEENKYEGLEGRLSSRTTEAYVCIVNPDDDCRSTAAGGPNPTQKFTQTFTYDALGAPTELEYPKCQHTNCKDLISDRTISNVYSHGLLTSTTWTGAVSPNRFRYHQSGLMSEVQHDNSVVDRQTIDSRVPSRPLSMITEGARDGGSCVVPSFSTQPQSKTIASGNSALLETSAVGETGVTITYQWYQGMSGNVANPVGTNSTQLSVSPTVTTSYWVKATSTCGSASSVTATVTVCSQPAVTLPADRTISHTASTNIESSPTGSDLRYQWYTVVSGTATAIQGASGSTLTVSPSQTTRYRIEVTNDCGTASDEIVVTVVDAPTAPGWIQASYNGSTGKNNLAWPASTSQIGIDHYVIERMPGGQELSTTGAQLSYVDGTGLLANAAYVYRVRAVDTLGVSSAYSPADLTTTVVLTNDPLTGGAAIRGIHVGELRRAIDAVRTAAGYPPKWTSYAAATGAISASTFTEMQYYLNQARAALGFPLVEFGEAVVSQQKIRVGRINELRGGVQ